MEEISCETQVCSFRNDLAPLFCEGLKQRGLDSAFVWFDDTKQYISYGINHKEEGKTQIEKHICIKKAQNMT